MIKGISDIQQQLVSALYQEKGNPFSDVSVCIEHGESGLSVSKKGSQIIIQLSDERLLARALALAESMIGKADDTITEVPCYRSLGVMIDCSRGAVPTPESLRKMFRILARMGYTVVQLYMEDTFELPGYPYFGYRRGSYTCKELSSLDQYAVMLGIELVPAVQTLAHMAQALRWPVFKSLVDTGDILLMEDEKVYALIDAIFSTLSKCFTSNRINIGMDEAHMLGLGKYLDQHGYHDRMGLMLAHLERVLTLARKYNLQPMLWSDMFFRLATGGDYYATECVVDKRIAETIPKDVSLLYWDYYSEDESVYDNMLTKHMEMTPNVIFAGGAWKWMGFSPNNGFSCKVANLAHSACKKHAISEVMLTAWGDNGAECSLFAVLPALQYWAELCYHGAVDNSVLQERFSYTCGGNIESFWCLDEPMLSPNSPAPGRQSVSPQRYALYQDILEGLFDLHIEPESYSAYYWKTAKKIQEVGKTAGSSWRYLFDTQYALCDLLAVKCRCGSDLRKAYQAGDLATLRKYCDEVLPDILVRLEKFVAAYHYQWLCENRPEGLATFDLRLGGLKQRIETAIERLSSYLRGDITELRELAAPQLSYDGKEHTPEDIDIQAPFWNLIVSPYDISMI